ncbi:unnamed protein product [Coregonus sp. 'balchen']|nr:unnamed protein product [Coregonus sp. 'balchen']
MVQQNGGDCSIDLVEETYRHFHMLDKLLGKTMGMTVDRPRVDFRKGSVLSYQQPKLTTKHIKLQQDAPPNPTLPLVDYQLGRAHGVTVVYAQEDVLVQRLHLEPEVTGVIREKAGS